jgi:hypothetical protein
MYVFFRFGAWRSCCLETYNQCFGFRSILDQTLLLCTDIKKYFRRVPNIYVPQVPALLSKYRHGHFHGEKWVNAECAGADAAVAETVA